MNNAYIATRSRWLRARALATQLTLLVAMIASAHAQGFTVSITPGSQQQTVDSAVYYVRVAPTGGFKASVYLSASMPTLPQANVRLSRSILNYPYADTARVVVTLTGANSGEHAVVVEGRNGPVVARDTAWLIPRTRSAWQVFDTTNSGLPTNTVHSIIIDRHNRKWMMTDSAIVRYDGASWTVFNMSEIDTGGASWFPAIACFAIDSSDNVWVGTSGALFRYDGDEWAAIDISAIADTFGVDYFLASSLAFDVNNDLWIAGSSRGFMLVKYSAGSVTAYRMTSGGSTVFTPRGLAAAPDGSIWSYDPLRKFDGTFWTEYSGDQLLGWPVAIEFDGSGSVWIVGTGLVKFTGSEIVKYPETASNQFPGSGMTTMAFDSSGRIWMGYAGTPWPDGVAVSQGTNSVTRKVFTSSNSGLPENSIRQIEVARDSSVWIVTASRGIAVYDPRLDNGTPLAVPMTREDAGVANAIIALAPNPARDDVRLHLRAGRARVDVVSPIGAVLRSIAVGAGNAEQVIHIDTEDLVAGRYLVRVTTDGRVETRTLVIVR